MAKRTGGTRSVGSGSAASTRSTGAIVSGSKWSDAVHKAQASLNAFLLVDSAPAPSQPHSIIIANDIKVELRNNKSTTSTALNDNSVTLQIVQNGNVLASETRNYGVSPMDGKKTTATDAMRKFYKHNSHLFDKIRYKY